MTSDEITAILVKLGRIEEALIALNGKLDKLEDQTEERFRRVDTQADRQWKKLNEHDTAIQILQDRQGPKVHWLTWVATIGALAAIILGVLDRIFVNQ